MAKKSNKTTNINKEVKNATTPLTVSQLYDVMEFANALYKDFGSVDDNRAYTPQLTNERLSSVTTSPRRQWKNVDVSLLIEDPITNQKNLVGYSEFLQLSDSIAHRTTQYLGNLPTFDYLITCTNASDKDYESEEYKEDWEKVKKFLTRFKPKNEFSRVNRRTMAIDAYYSVFRMDSENYVFEELPRDYCTITGKNADWGYVFDFDMGWFLLQGLSLKQYPPNFQRMWRRVFGDIEDIKEYNPANGLKERDGVFAQWTQTSPLPSEGNFACFKFNSDVFTTIPFLTALFGDAHNKPLVRALQTNQYIIASHKIVVGLIPLLKEQKSGQIKDALAIAPSTMGQFLGLLKKGLPEAVKIGGVPFSDVKDINFTLTDKNIYEEQNKAIAASSGVTSRFVYASDKLTAAEVNFNAMIDEMIATQVYPQYSVWTSSMINTFTSKYKFKVTFNGTYFDRDKRLDRAEKLANRGMFIDQLYANAIGTDIFELHSLMEMGNHSNFYDMLRLPPNSNVASPGSMDSGSGGRSRKSVTEIADSTERNPDYEGDL